jgi:aminoglycoside phosphotransferase (APT) family kinase protein
VMAAVASQGVPVPQMLALCMDEAVIGRCFFVMSHVDGLSHLDQSLPDLQPEQRRQIYQAMAQALASLHGVDVARAGLSDFGKPQDYVARQIARWSRQYQASITEPIPEMDRLMAWLPVNLPRSATKAQLATVIHGDFRLDNLIFSPWHDAVRAIIDWELSTVGHPLADLSYHTMSWHIPPEVWRGMAGLDLTSLGIPSEQEQLMTYAQQRPEIDLQSALEDWHFYLAYNLFRMAAILQGIGRRLADGLAASPQAQANAAAARPLAELAWHTAQSGKAIGRRV